MSKYFITGATGTVGQHVVNALLEKNKTIISATRHPENSDRVLPENVESVFFDFEEGKSYSQALNSSGIFLLGPPLYVDLFNLLEPFVDYLISHNYKGSLVYLSAYGMEAMPEMPFHAQMEKKLKASNLHWNVVRPGFFMQNFGNYERENIEDRGILFSPAGSGKTPFVSAKDIGASIAELLTNVNRINETHILTGNEPYSYFEIAEMLSKIIGKTIVYPNPDEQTYRHVLQEAGTPDFIADYMIPVYRLIKNGVVKNTHKGVQDLTGNEPEKIRVVLERDFG